MALVIEDGTGRADAESFVSVADATAYHAARANAAWAAIADDATREAYLRRATDYMEQVYRLRWAGVRKLTTQSLSWPRYNVPVKDVPITQYYPNDAVPAVVVHACAELALRAIKGELAPDVGPLKKRVKVAVIETEYVIGATPYVRFRAVDRMLDPFMSGTAGSIQLVRA